MCVMQPFSHLQDMAEKRSTEIFHVTSCTHWLSVAPQPAGCDHQSQGGDVDSPPGRRAALVASSLP